MSRRTFAEALLVAALFGLATWWGGRYWRLSLAAGREPQFYREYFEPAVMMACGRGFVVASSPVPAIDDFLTRGVPSFDCVSIPPDVHLRSPALQGAWRYLMTAVALGWRVFGLSWDAIGKMAALAFGACIVLAYAICRVALPWAFAVAAASMWAVSTVHLLQLPHFRDYLKGPFILACLWMLGLLIVKPRPARTVLTLAALYGLTVGIGYGFRPDVLIAIVPFLVAVTAFLPTGTRWDTKLTAIAVFALTFGISAWPVIRVVSRDGSCQGHFALLGLTTEFTDVLDIEPASYDWGAKYSDRWVYATIASYSEREHPSDPLIAYCSHQYDVVSAAYLRQIITTFPADMATRGLATARRILQLPWANLEPPLPAVNSFVYAWRFRVLRHFRGTELLWISCALIGVACVNGRASVFLLFVVAYFLAYPAIQYGQRHVFHLEVIPIWAIAVSCYLCVSALYLLATNRPQLTHSARRGILALVVGVVLIVSVWGGLGVLRTIQARHVEALFRTYLDAQKSPSPLGPPDATGLRRISMPSGQRYPHQFLDVVVPRIGCGRTSITFRYEKRPDADLTRTIEIPAENISENPAHIFIPVYESFEGLEISAAEHDCSVDVFRVSDNIPTSLLLTAVLPAVPQNQRRFQSLRAW